MIVELVRPPVQLPAVPAGPVGAAAADGEVPARAVRPPALRGPGPGRPDRGEGRLPGGRAAGAERLRHRLDQSGPLPAGLGPHPALRRGRGPGRRRRLRRRGDRPGPGRPRAAAARRRRTSSGRVASSRSSTPARSTSTPAGWRRFSSCWPPCRPSWPSTWSGPRSSPRSARRRCALLAVFGASDAALLDVVFGRAEPRGRLPIQLPRSMDDGARRAAGCAQGVRRPAVRLRCRAQPGSATEALLGLAVIRSAAGREHGRFADLGRLVAVSSVSGPCRASSRRCASASARSGSCSSCW